MTALIIMSAVVLIGIIAAFAMLKSDKDDNAQSEGSLSEALSLAEESEMSSPEEPAPSELSAPSPKPEKKKGGSLVGKLLGGLKKKKAAAQEPSAGPVTALLGKLNISGLMGKFKRAGEEPAEDEIDIPEGEPLPSLTDSLSMEEAQSVGLQPRTGTASLRTVPADEPVEETASLPPEPEPGPEPEAPPAPGATMPPAGKKADQADEFKAKIERLEALLIEKGNELLSTKQSLENEINNRKEFDKVKELLENEIVELKGRSRDAKSEGENVQADLARYEKRTAELEKVITQLEKNLDDKDAKIDELIKRLQTFASPATAATPPVKENPEPEPPAADERAEEKLPGIRLAPAEERDAPAPPEEEPPAGEPLLDGAPPPDLLDEPPEPYAEEGIADDSRGGGFLKLQPDIISDADAGDAGKSGSVGKEIEESLEVPPESRIPSDPGPTTPDNERIIEIVDPDEIPRNLDNNDNTEPTKE